MVDCTLTLKDYGVMWDRLNFEQRIETRKLASELATKCHFEIINSAYEGLSQDRLYAYLYKRVSLLENAIRHELTLSKATFAAMSASIREIECEDLEVIADLIESL